ncbi:phosphate acyltransferase PlsX [Periweissella ghanensis]|uniref:Phosphate acyltransferase n=1 Tax=Periweissella ghanensis TaxID=467997 RepID=A0ABN8BKC7_9LACO|nr:phosphate acyltransferase PlsX [Periweissella ghanensis]MCM0601729.1 phosphate acyltransferase PlsX [Periweissella ghanensis]CAH0418161.1 Phosphate acyltransferase [Periweissella ghanensis]
MKIAVDAMGGDYAPLEIVKGVEKSRDQFSDMEFILFGDEAKIKAVLKDTTRVTIHHTDDMIEMGEEPVRAIRRKKNSSMVLAANAVKNGEADAFFSAGNTGAILAAGIFIVGRIKGIDRPALATVLPSVSGPHDSFVMMDMGANAESKAAHLYQYGFLGDFYAEKVLGFENPRVGLLNLGTEEDKGDEVHKEAWQLLNKAPKLNYIGNVEARELLNGAADVVVTDGSNGNTALKAIEGTALTIINLLKESILGGGVKAKLGGLLIKDALRGMRDKMDYTKAGGAVLLGVNAPVVKTHGSAKEQEVANTFAQIHTMVQNGLVPAIQDYIANHADVIKATTTEEDKG